MNPRFQNQNNGNDKDENLFSKVLSGMKSVFNNANKSRKQKTSPGKHNVQDQSSSISSSSDAVAIEFPNDADAGSSICNETHVVEVMSLVKDDAPQTSQCEIDNQLVIENVLGIDEFLPHYSTVSTTTTDEIDISSLNLLYQTNYGDSVHTSETEIIVNEPIQENVVDDNINVTISNILMLPVYDEQNALLLESNMQTMEESESKTFDEDCFKTVEVPESKPTQKTKKSKLKGKSKTHSQKHNVELVQNDILDESKPSTSDTLTVVDGKEDIEVPQNKPRIVLKFRSEKSGPRSTNVKIVSDEKFEGDAIAIISRRSLRGKSLIISDNSLDETKKEVKKPANLPEIETQSFVNANSESDESARTPPFLRKSKLLNQSDSNSEDSPPLNKEKIAIKRSARRRSKEFSESVLANAIARKEKILNETLSGQTRLSRRIKPTAKVLANRELRLGLETQNNARLALVSEKNINPDEIKVTRSSSKRTPEKSTQYEKPKMKKQVKSNCDDKKIAFHDEKIELIKNDKTANFNEAKPQSTVSATYIELLSKESDISIKASSSKHIDKNDSGDQNDEDSERRRLNKLKKKHLKKLGLKAVSEHKSRPKIKDRDIITDESTMDSTKTEAIIEHLNTRNQCNTSSLEENMEPELQESLESTAENDELIKIEDFSIIDTKKIKISKHSKKKVALSDSEESMTGEKKLDNTKNEDEVTFRITRKRFKLSNSREWGERDTKIVKATYSDKNVKKGSSSQSCTSKVNLMSCLCNDESNLYAESDSISDPEFCRAVENIGGRHVGCGRPINSYRLVRAGSRASFFLACDMHHRRLALHHCCSGCGVFCTQGVHYQCSEGHIFHWECSLPFVPLLIPSGHMTDRESSPCADQPAQPKGTITDLYNAEPGCPHCGLDSVTLDPINIHCFKVNLQMNCSGPTIFLPNPRLQWVPARMSFSSNSKLLNSPSDDNDDSILPQDFLETLKNYFLSDNSTVDYDNLLADENKCDSDLIDAVFDSENAIDKILVAIKNGADPRKRISSINDGTFMHLAVKELNLSALYIFRTLGLELDAYDKRQITPLMLAIISYENEVEDQELEENYSEGVINNIVGNTVAFRRIINYLVKAGCDLALKGPGGATVLHFAAKNGDAITCLSLLNCNSFKAKAIINQQDDSGLTPLIWAIENKHSAIARLLLEHGANPMIKDLENNTSIHWAASTGCKTIVEDLLNFGSEVNVINANADTPLHLSARQNQYSCLIILLARGASISLRNLDGETAIDCVVEDTCDCYTSLAINEQLQNIISFPSRDEKTISNDISNGKELNPIRCVNSVDDEDLNGVFTYITKNCFTVDINIDRKLSSMQVCNCKDGCGQTEASCMCTNVSMQSWYDINGRLVPCFDYSDPPMIFECNDICACNKLHCINRGIDKGASVTLKIFRQKENAARGGGWGICTTQPILKGSFVCEYVGEILPGSLAYHREDDSYLFELETKGDILQEITEPYCIDAKNYGNVSRFINHKCEPNLVPVRIFVDHRDLRFPRIAFFACKDISIDEELGFDYGEKFWNIKSKSFACNCGSLKCRYNQTDDAKEFESDQDNVSLRSEDKDDTDKLDE